MQWDEVPRTFNVLVEPNAIDEADDATYASAGLGVR